MMLRLAFLVALLAPGAAAETLVAAATIRAKTVLMPEHLATIGDRVPGALSDPSDALGLETRVVLYAGRPIRPTDVGPPALIERNQIVQLLFQHAGLTIATEGRALARAAAGETVRVLNLASRTTVTGHVDPAGRIRVGPTLPPSVNPPGSASARNTARATERP